MRPSAKTGRVVRGLAVFACGVGAALVVLPARLAFTPGSGHRGLLGATPVVPDGTAFAAGAFVTFVPPAPDPDASSLALRLRLKRGANPVRLLVERDRKPIASSRISPEPAWLEVPLEPETAAVRLLADAERDDFATLYLIERLELRRRFGPRRMALTLLPGLVGGLVAGLLAASPVVAVLWGLHAALGMAGALVHTLDAAAALQLASDQWRTAAAGFSVSLAALLLVPRLLARAEDERGPRLRPRHVAAASLLIAALLIGLAGTVVSSNEALGRLFGEASLRDIDVVRRARSCSQALFGAAGVALYLGLFAGTLRSLDRLREARVNALVFGILTLALLGATEGVLAPRYRPVYRPVDPNIMARAERATYLGDPELGHVLNPDSDRPYVINEVGLRGAEIPPLKPSGELRIATLGDSIPFGIDLPEDTPFGVHLERRLAARHSEARTYRVINGGVPAYDSLQVLRAFRRVVLPLKPDIVTVTVGWNDLSWALGSGWHPERSVAYRWQPPRFRPALLRFAEELAAPRAVRLGEPDPRAVQAFRVNLEAIVAEARGRGVRVLITNMPTILSAAGNTEEELRTAKGKLKVDWQLQHVRRFDAQIEAVCSEHVDVGCAHDLFPLEEQGKGAYFRDHCHPNADGHALIARRLLRRLEELGWL